MDEEKKAQWEERLAAHAVSGMTVIDWCRENGMTKHTYYYWKKRICNQKVEEQPDETPLFAELPVKLKACGTQGDGSIVHFSGKRPIKACTKNNFGGLKAAIFYLHY